MKTYIEFIAYFIGLCCSLCCAIIFPICTENFTPINIMVEGELIGIAIAIGISFFCWIYDTLGDDF